jgi:hypothetical protein
MVKTLRVRSTRRDDDRAVLNDENEAHPGGHVLIVGDGKVHEVGDVRRVRDLIDEGLLEIVEAREKKADATGA